MGRGFEPGRGVGIRARRGVCGDSGPGARGGVGIRARRGVGWRFGPGRGVVGIRARARGGVGIRGPVRGVNYLG